MTGRRRLRDRLRASLVASARQCPRRSNRSRIKSRTPSTVERPVTDHDDIVAGLELQSLTPGAVPPSRSNGRLHLPAVLSPGATCRSNQRLRFARLSAITADPPPGRSPRRWPISMRSRARSRLNHPHWDLPRSGVAHARAVRQFLDCHGQRLHAPN